MQVMSYAVRGPLAIRAVELEKEIKAVAASLLLVLSNSFQIISIKPNEPSVCYGHQIQSIHPIVT